MNYESLVSVKNLELAWRRINTGRNLQYKRFFRPVYLAYEAGLRENLRLLRKDLLAGWQARSPTRVYLPKPSGLQRPITLLHLEDQIVLQAISNVFAEKLRERRAEVEHKIVFSNVLSSQGDSIFFVHRWQQTYQEFLKACTKHFNDGYRWIAHFDLAAYYDTISHVQLVRQGSPRGGHGRTRRKVQEWLRTWTTHDGSPAKEHGIPQGPVASNFLAEAFFLPIDERMSKLDVRYTRYVDDIRMFGKTQTAVQEAAIILEVVCQSHGLIPQGKKFAIEEARGLDNVLGQLPSVPPEGDEMGAELASNDAEKVFREALDGRPLRVIDKSRMRYVLYRAPKSEKLLRWVLALMPHHPEHIDAFAHYLSNYAYRKPIIRAVKNFLDSKTPYSYVRGELWHILARIAPQDFLRRNRTAALNELRTAGGDVAYRWGLFHFLLRCEKEDIGSVSTRLLSQHEFTQALLAEYLPECQYDSGLVAAKLLKQKKLEPCLVLGRAMRERNQKLGDYGMRSRDLSDKAQNVFKGLGVIRRRKLVGRDYVGEILARLYGCPKSQCWKGLLGGDYEYALQILLEAEAGFNINRSAWLRNQNSFNDMLVRSFIRALDLKGLPGVVRIIGRDSKLVKLGVIVQTGAAFDQNYPVISRGFREANARRNKIPGSHPYDERGGSRNKFLTKREQDCYVSKLQGAFNEVIAVCRRESLV